MNTGVVNPKTDHRKTVLRTEKRTLLHARD